MLILEAKGIYKRIWFKPSIPISTSKNYLQFFHLLKFASNFRKLYPVLILFLNKLHQVPLVCAEIVGNLLTCYRLDRAPGGSSLATGVAFEKASCQRASGRSDLEGLRRRQIRLQKFRSK